MHTKGLYSDTSSLRDVFASAGYTQIEPFFFGVGEGLSFNYWNGKNLKYPVIDSRIGPSELCRRACDTLGCAHTVHTSSSPRRAHAAMVEMIDRGLPVMLNADTFFLTYLNDPNHYGARSIVVAGIDEATSVAYVADNTLDSLVPLTFKALSEARASPYRPFPPRNRWYVFEASSRIEADARTIMGAIGRNAIEMLNSGTRNSGIGGIYYFASCLRSWQDVYTPKELEAVCQEIRHAITARSQCGFSRRMYADFLDLANEITEIEALSGIADEYRRASNLWDRTARMIGEVHCGCVSLSEVADHVTGIAALEHELQISLMSAANLCCRR